MLKASHHFQLDDALPARYSRILVLSLRLTPTNKYSRTTGTRPLFDADEFIHKFVQDYCFVNQLPSVVTNDESRGGNNVNPCDIPNIDFLSHARRVFSIESSAVAELANNLDDAFAEAARHILRSDGRVIVCGMGKSGIIGKKISATFASTGTPSFFMHPGEAFHGDLGMVTKSDVFLAISNSGETSEVLRLLPFLKDNGNILIALTGSKNSTLSRIADCHLDVSVQQEACPLHLAPTASTTATLAMGDALAIALMEARDFKPEHFARFHPGGSLGRRLLGRVEHEMISSELPLIQSSASTMDVIKAITRSTLGIAIVQDIAGFPIITDGDLRRALERFGRSFFDASASDFMTRDPVGVQVGTRIEDAINLMTDRKISSLLVFDRDKLVGVFKR